MTSTITELEIVDNLHHEVNTTIDLALESYKEEVVGEVMRIAELYVTEEKWEKFREEVELRTGVDY